MAKARRRRRRGNAGVETCVRCYPTGFVQGPARRQVDALGRVRWQSSVARCDHAPPPEPIVDRMRQAAGEREEDLG